MARIVERHRKLTDRSWPVAAIADDKIGAKFTSAFRLETAISLVWGLIAVSDPKRTSISD